MRPSASTVSVVFSPASAAHADRRVDQHRRSGEHARRRRDARDREVAAEPLLADAYRIDRHAARLEREQRRARGRRRRCPRRRSRRSRRPAACRPDRYRTPFERGGEIGAAADARRAGVLGGAGTARRRSGRCAPRTAPRAGERARSCRRRRAASPPCALAAVHVGDAHAARVVEQDGQHVALRHGARQHLGRAQQAARARCASASARIAPSTDPVDSADAAKLPIGEHDERQRSQGRECDQPDGDDRRQHELAATEQPRRILEQKGEDGLERSFQSPPDRWTCLAAGGRDPPSFTRSSRKWFVDRCAAASVAQRPVPRGTHHRWMRNGRQALPTAALPTTMRIVKGRFAGRDLVSPNDARVRPTAEHVRAAMLDLLEPELPRARVLDLFAGTGALGLEAISRGAASADFVETRPSSLHALRANVALAAAPRPHAGSSSATRSPSPARWPRMRTTSRSSTRRTARACSTACSTPGASGGSRASSSSSTRRRTSCPRPPAASCSTTRRSVSMRSDRRDLAARRAADDYPAPSSSGLPIRPTRS